jgi:hypothetical protein
LEGQPYQTIQLKKVDAPAKHEYSTETEDACIIAHQSLVSLWFLGIQALIVGKGLGRAASPARLPSE